MSQQTQSNDFSYLFFRNGASFQINYQDQDDNPRDEDFQPLKIRSPTKLTELCCLTIVQNDELTRSACQNVPHELFYPLFRAALQFTNDDTCVNILITHWPYRVFRLENFVEKKLTSLKMLLCDKTALQRTKQAIKYSVIIIPRFIDSIRQQQQEKLSNLRVLDVTNFPVVELILRYISTHCRLAEKESRRNQLIDMYHQQHQEIEPMIDENETKDSTDLIKSNSYPDDQIIIRFDCIIQDYRTYVELLSALRSTTPNIQLQICTIDMRCIGLALVSNFLDHVDRRVSFFLREIKRNLSLKKTYVEKDETFPADAISIRNQRSRNRLV